MEPLRNVVMLEDDFSDSDVIVGGVDVEGAQLIDGDGERNRTVYNGIIESEGCWWSMCVYPCNDVASSQRRIKMRNSMLSRVPRTLCSRVAPSLNILDLTNNQISSIPSWIGVLQQLSELHLDNNSVSHVDPALYTLSALRVLSLRNNNISYFERAILSMALEDLRVHGNPLGWPPREVAVSSASLTLWARKYQAPPTYRIVVPPRAHSFRHIDITYHAHYYLGPDPEKNEDRHHILIETRTVDTVSPFYHQEVLPPPMLLYWGIYDGHSGHRVADSLEHAFHGKLREGGCFDVTATAEEIQKRVQSVYLATDATFVEHLAAETNHKKRKPGSCCTAVWIMGSRLVVSHVGDSRVIMVGHDGTTQELAPDHHPDAPRERERVEARGGEIVFRGCWRVHSPEEGMYLAVSRAFGDICLKTPKLVIDADPDVLVRPLETNDRWLVIASDGLWCRLENHQVAEAIQTCKSAGEATDRLIWEAKRARTHDNTTVIVVKLDAN